MITGELKSRVDKLWEEFWTGGITNPLTVIEQISYLIFLRMLDERETLSERRRAKSRAHVEMLYGPKEQELRWSQLKHVSDPKELLDRVRGKVFPHLRGISAPGSALHEHIKDAQLLIQKPSLLDSAMRMITALPLGDADTKGDLYEYLLSKLTTAGINGQFRTPRHVIRFMVELVEPAKGELVGDPACGTAGFLVGVKRYLDDRKVTEMEDARKFVQQKMLHGFDFDRTMLQIASMNLALHGIEPPDIRYQDALSKFFEERQPDLAAGVFDVILANPPFKGSLDENDVAPDLLRVVKTKKTELLFLILILRMLKSGGRSATIVPDGVLFRSSTDYKAIRKVLVDQHGLQAVISLPAGVFKPYAGVSTAIVVFTKDSQTDHVLFYDVTADGYSLDDKRTPAGGEVGRFGPVKDNDLYDAIERWRKRSAKKDTDRTAKHFMVPVRDIRDKEYDLSINRYKEAVHETVTHESPKKILARLRALEKEIAKDLAELEGML